MRAGGRTAAALALAVAAAAGDARADGGRTEVLLLRGVPQTLHLYGMPGNRTAIVTSGDGGWVHLGPEVAAFLASRGYLVLGLDAKAYLASFTSRSGPLGEQDVPRDFLTLVDRVGAGAGGRPLLVGVSEGAGLSVLAATSPEVQARVAGVVGLGLPDQNELGWRWRDSIIYLTKKTPDEPTFSARALAGRVSPVPLALIHSSRDEFVPLAEVQGIFAQAREPKQMWVVEAADHRFSDNRPGLQRRLEEAIAWIGTKAVAQP